METDQQNNTGRPSLFSKELSDRICERLAGGESMRTICRDDDMPCMATVFKWLRENKEFSEQYARAKQEGTDAIVEEMQDIADDGTNDWMERQNEDGDNIGWQVNGENIQRSKLRIDTRKWIASKLKPKKYGEKLDLTTGGDKINTQEPQTLLTLLKTARAVLQNVAASDSTPSETDETPQDANEPTES